MRDIEILGKFHLHLRNAFEVEKGFGMSKASQHAVEEWEKKLWGSPCEPRSLQNSDATVVVADQLQVGESLVFSVLTECHFCILFQVIVSKTEDWVVHIEQDVVVWNTAYR